MLFPENQTGEQNHDDRDKLGDHGNVLQDGTVFDSQAVVCGEDDDDHYGDQLDCHLRHVHKVIQRGYQSNGQRRDGTGTAYQPARKAEGIADRRVVGFVQIDNHAA